MTLPGRRSARAAGAFGLAAILLLSSGLPRASPMRGGLEVDYAGCFSVYRSPFRCAPGDEGKPRRLRLWVPVEPGAMVEIRGDGGLLDLDSVEVSGGRRYALAFPQSRLTVVVRPRGGGEARSWSLPIAPRESYPWWDTASRLADENKQDAIRPYLEHQRQERPRREQGFVLEVLGKQAQRSNSQAAAVLYQWAMQAHGDAGRASGVVEVAGLLARVDLDEREFREAREVLERAAAELPPAAPAEAKFDLAYDRGLLEKQLGDYRTALVQLEAAVDLAARTGMEDGAAEWRARQALGSLFQRLGRAREAEETFRQLRAHPPGDPCDLVTLLENWGFSHLLAREAGEGVEDPLAELDEALKIFEEGSCGDPARQFNARLNLAFAYQLSGRWPDSRRLLAIDHQPPPGANLDERLWWLDLRARDALEGRSYALALGLYDQLARLASENTSREGDFQALLGRARTQRAQGSRAEALASLARADGLIDEEAAYIPVDEGLESFVARREAATRLYIETLLDDGQKKQALELVRRARSRVLRRLATRARIAELTPAERERWEKSLAEYLTVRREIDDREAERGLLALDERSAAGRRQDERFKQARQSLDRTLAEPASLAGAGRGELSPPLPGEVILAYHPLSAGWEGFAYDGRKWVVARLGLTPTDLAVLADPAAPVDPTALGRLLLEPFHAQIERARRVRVLPYGPLWAVDFHTLVFDGAPLLAHRRVVYSLDLSAPAPAAPPRAPVALVISDPLGNLSMARREGDEVRRAIRGWGAGWSVDSLPGRQATASAVSRALAGATLAHYAGHGVFQGSMGWDSEFPLAGGSRLTLGDVLTLRRAPTWIVLSGCDASRSSAESPGEGIGLAQAFLLAGAESVVAPVRPVDDAAARTLVDELYRGWRPGEDLALRLQQAQMAIRNRGRGGDWASFRLLER